MTDTTRLKATVYIGGLDSAVNERTLIDAFIPFGEIVEVSIPKSEQPSSTEPHRGFGYVEFGSPDDAHEAIDNMDQSELFGRVIKVSAAKPQKESNEGLGSKTAVWEQEGYLTKYAAAEAPESNTAIEDVEKAQDPVDELESFDVAGPRPK